MSKKLKWFTAIGSLLLVVVMGYTLYVNASVKSVESGRDARLDLYESTKSGIISDMRAFLTIKNKSDYDLVRKDIHFTPELKDELLGSSYNPSLASYDSVQVLDIQYSLLDKDGANRYNMIATLTNKGVKKTLTFILFVENNKIYDILVY